MKRLHSGGQALAEFALTIVVVLMLLFLILEAGRILWAWVTVQSAARDGARYAVTGQDGCETGYDRVQCVVTTTFRSLATLPLNDDPNALFEDDNYYLIQVYGVDETGQLLSDYAGAPGQPVVVRAIYRVPLVTPFFRPIRQSIPIFGQVVMNNEQWGNLGGATAGVGLPPPMPDVPTPGVTPSPTATSTPGPTPTGTATATPTVTVTATRCPTQFEGSLVQGEDSANVTGELYSNVTLFDTSVTTTPGVFPTIASVALGGPYDGHACDGFAQPIVDPPFEGGHVILVRNDTPGDDTFDTAIVLTGTPTYTPSPTPTPTLSPTVPPTLTPAPSQTPSSSYLVLFPSCGFGPNVNIHVQGYNFPSGTTVNLFWREDGQQPAYQGAAVGPTISQMWQLNNVSNGTHQVQAIYGSTTRTANFVVPCANITATAPAATATPTPVPPDLIVSGPVLISTPPIVEYRPLQFEFTISNIGDIDVDTQFFTDVYLDPPATAIRPEGIGLDHSDGYQASSSLAAGATRVIVVNSPLGFTGGLVGTRTVYGMVDSVLQVAEGDETNNVSSALHVPNVTPAPSPTPSPTVEGAGEISGQVMAFIGNWAPQRRAQVWLVDTSTATVSAGPVQTEYDGRYFIGGVAPGTYNLYACIEIDNLTFVGARPGISPSTPFGDIFMSYDPLGCPIN